MRKSMLLIILALLFVISCSNRENFVVDNITLSCITEPGKAYYPANETCCNGLKSIFGSEAPDGTCFCTEKDNDCGGAPVCAPCGNGICEDQYWEDKCNCKEDCK